jgi:hypothetical protein
MIALTRPDGKTAWFKSEGILGVELPISGEGEPGVLSRVTTAVGVRWFRETVAEVLKKLGEG